MTIETIPFEREVDALNFAKTELAKGQAVTLWPVKDQAYIIAAQSAHTTAQQSEQGELVGRMYECCDIEMAITSGQFKTLDDVLIAVRSSSEAIENKLKEAGVQFAKSGKAGDLKHDAYMAGTLMDLKLICVDEYHKLPVVKLTPNMGALQEHFRVKP